MTQTSGTVDRLEPRMLFAADFGWATSIGGPSKDGIADVGVDRAGNAYLTGVFRGTVDFDRGPGSAVRTSAGGIDTYLAKYSPGGSLLWVRTFGAAGSDDGMALAVDDGGNVIVSGFFAGTVDFDPGPARRALTAAGPSDGFVARFRGDGSLVWVRQIGGGGDAGGTALAVAASGDVYSFGMFRGAATIGAVSLQSRGDLDVYLARFRADGSIASVVSFGGPGVDYANGVAVDSSGTARVVGSFFGSVDFDPGTGERWIASAGSSDVFIATLDASGRLAAVSTIGGTGADQAGDVALVPGGMVVAGNFSGTADFDPASGVRALRSAGSTDAFLLKLSNGGQYVWARRFGGAGKDRATDVAADGAGNTYITGHFAGQVDFDPGAKVTRLQSASGSSDAFIVKMTAGGALGRARALRGPTNADVGETIVLGPGATLLAAGRFGGTVDFDPGAGVFNLKESGGEDGYLVKLTAV